MARHLPIVNQKPAPAPGTVDAPDEGDDRPPWHWSGIGAALVFVLWLPLAMVGQWLSQLALSLLLPADQEGDMSAFLRSASATLRAEVRVATVLPHALMFALAAVAGGALVGRFGGQAGVREASVAGLSAATVAWLLTALSVGLSGTWILWFPAAVIGFSCAWLGGRLGFRKRPRN